MSSSLQVTVASCHTISPFSSQGTVSALEILPEVGDSPMVCGFREDKSIHFFLNEKQNQPQCFAASSSSIKFRIMSTKAGFLPLHHFQIMHVVHSTGCFIGIPLMG